ncbi:MAG: hypothetical protein H0W75_08480 [Chitinophagaceae bacterium]|nr:hypothetical protein [Chitinophagaceae bacterium]
MKNNEPVLHQTKIKNYAEIYTYYPAFFISADNSFSEIESFSALSYISSKVILLFSTFTDFQPDLITIAA